MLSIQLAYGILNIGDSQEVNDRVPELNVNDCQFIDIHGKEPVLYLHKGKATVSDCSFSNCDIGCVWADSQYEQKPQAASLTNYQFDNISNCSGLTTVGNHELQWMHIHRLY